MRALLLLLALGASAPAPAQTSGLGRLFLGPAEREQLDAQRATGQAVAPPVVQAEAPAPPAPPAPPVTLNGIIQRSGGKSTVWLNDAQQNEPHNQLGDSTRPTLTLPLSSGRKVTLRPGQTLNLNERAVRDVDAK